MPCTKGQVTFEYGPPIGHSILLSNQPCERTSYGVTILKGLLPPYSFDPCPYTKYHILLFITLHSCCTNILHRRKICHPIIRVRMLNHPRSAFPILLSPAPQLVISHTSLVHLIQDFPSTFITSNNTSPYHSGSRPTPHPPTLLSIFFSLLAYLGHFLKITERILVVVFSKTDKDETIVGQEIRFDAQRLHL